MHDERNAVDGELAERRLARPQHESDLAEDAPKETAHFIAAERGADAQRGLAVDESEALLLRHCGGGESPLLREVRALRAAALRAGRPREQMESTRETHGRVRPGEHREVVQEKLA